MRRLFVLIAAAAAALGLLSAAQGGSFPGTSGLIAFTCAGGICTATDGAVYGNPLISSGENPAWSASGTKLAYENGSDVYTANADGSGQTLLKLNADEPTWSPDNATVAFVTTVSGGTHIWSRNGSNETQLTSAAGFTDSDPAYSPTIGGVTKLAFSTAPSSGGNGQIWVGTVPTTPGPLTNLVQLTTGTTDDETPSWSPNGSTIVYSASGNLYTVPANGSSAGTPLAGLAGYDPSYSPDGTQISYRTVSGKLSIVDASGSNPHSVTAASSLFAADTDWGEAQPPAVTTPPDTANGPKNTSYPTITLASGDSSPVVGHLLFSSVGSWTGTFPISYTYQWKRCDPADPVNGPCVNITGATFSSYTPAPADFGYRIRVAVTASNSDGRTTQNSEVTAPTIAIAAKVTTTPQVVPGGSPVVDTPLTLTAGVWAGSTPITFTYSWRRCNPVGDFASCVPIVGATGASYTPTVADIGISLRVWITGTNLAGSDTAITNHTFPIIDKQHFAPSAVTEPTVVGTALPGRQLTANIGTYKGDSPIATTYHWYRCDATGVACHAIPGATKVVYFPTTADIGYTIRLWVFSKNAYGQLLSQSDPTDTVAANPPHVKGKHIVGTSKADYLAGGGHDDTIEGLAGNDTLLGGAGDDKLDGGKGNDVLTGGAGADKLLGGPGSDTINAADGERDTIDCGDGNDRAVVDPYDIVKNCEVVQRQTAPTP